MPTYDLPIWAHDREEFPPEGVRGNAWQMGARQVRVRDDDEEEAHFLQMREKYPRYSTCKIGLGNGQWRVAPQVFVEAGNRIVAQRVCGALR